MTKEELTKLINNKEVIVLNQEGKDVTRQLKSAELKNELFSEKIGITGFKKLTKYASNMIKNAGEPD